MTIREFVEDLFDHCPYTPEYMSIEDAQVDLDNFASYEDWVMPEGITAEEYSRIWNELLEEQNS